MNEVATLRAFGAALAPRGVILIRVPAYRRRLESAAEESGLGRKIIFTGFLGEKEKVEALRDADAFVLPSRHENFGVSVVEAMSMKVPVVVSNQVGLHPDVDRYKAGFTIHLGVPALVSAIEALGGDRSLRVSMGENGHRLVKEELCWGKIAQRVIVMYKAAAG